MFEIYTGTKAGRPTLLLLLSAGVLVGALGLAWMQVRGSRALGDGVRIEGTPLVVRPPKGWLPGRDRPGVFVKTIASGRQGRKREVVERSIRFEYRRWRVFQPLPDLLRLANYLDEKQAYEPEPAQIGGLDGVQVRRARVFRWFGRQEFGESIYRLACTARGDQVSLEYAPLGELSPGDMELFDAVCRAVVLDDPSLNGEPDEVLRHAGVRFPVAANWTILGPDYPEVCGLYVQTDESGIPVWGLGVFRTCLAPGRRPRDLLTTFAELRWPEFGQGLEPQERFRSDGAAIAGIQRPAFERAGGQVVSAWVVAKSPAEAAVIFALADAGAALDAARAAAKLAEEIEFLTRYPPGGVEPAAAGGRELAALFGEKGAAPWWDAAEATSYYLGEVDGQPLLVESRREAVSDDPRNGYAGFDRYIFRDRSEDKSWAWIVDGQTDGYTYREETGFDHRRRATAAGWGESRKAGETAIRRRNDTEPRFRERRIPVGRAFVCPAFETLAAGWVAQQDEGERLIEVSPLRGSTTNTQLLTPLGPDQDGRLRVLLVDDYWPRGMILAFDADLELAYQTAPTARFDRVTRPEAEEILRVLGRRR